MTNNKDKKSGAPHKSNLICHKSVIGFTLIETLIYTVLISFVVGAALNGAYGIIQGSGQLNNRAVIDEEANFLMRKVAWALGSAELILLPTSGNSGQSLSLNRYSFPLNPVVFDLNGGNFRMSYGTNPPIVLNTDRAVISSLSFTHIAATLLKPDGVNISFTLNNRTYSTTIYLNK